MRRTDLEKFIREAHADAAETILYDSEFDDLTFDLLYDSKESEGIEIGVLCDYIRKYPHYGLAFLVWAERMIAFDKGISLEQAKVTLLKQTLDYFETVH